MTRSVFFAGQPYLIHLAKLTRLEPTTAQPDYLAVGGGSLPSQTDSGGSDGRSSLIKSDPPDPIVYITQFLVILYSPLQFRPSLAHSHSVPLTLLVSPQSLTLLISLMLNSQHHCQPTPSPI